MKDCFDGVDVFKLLKFVCCDYEQYKEFEEIIENKCNDLQFNVMLYICIFDMMDVLIEKIGKELENIKLVDIQKFEDVKGDIGKVVQFMSGIMVKGEEFVSVYE